MKSQTEQYYKDTSATQRTCVSSIQADLDTLHEEIEQTPHNEEVFSRLFSYLNVLRDVIEQQDPQ